MPKRLDYQLSDDELALIRKAIKSAHPKVAQRATILYALHLGDKPTLIAQRHDIDLSTVYNTVTRYRKQGIQGLFPRPKSGRPTALNEEQSQHLVTLVDTDPRELGYGFTIWTGQRLQLYLADKLGIVVCEDTVRNTLARMGYVYRRPKKSLKHVQDAGEVARFLELLSELKKEPTTVISGSSLWTKVD